MILIIIIIVLALYSIGTILGALAFNDGDDGAAALFFFFAPIFVPLTFGGLFIAMFSYVFLDGRERKIYKKGKKIRTRAIGR